MKLFITLMLFSQLCWADATEDVKLIINDLKGIYASEKPSDPDVAVDSPKVRISRLFIHMLNASAASKVFKQMKATQLSTKPQWYVYGVASEDDFQVKFTKQF